MTNSDPTALMRRLTSEVADAVSDGLALEAAALASLAMTARIITETFGNADAAARLREMAEIVAAEKETRQ